jgi:hypothetical protein
VLDERARHELYLGVEEVLGTQRADTLMSLLPPVGWAGVATKDDIRLVENEIRQLEERVDARFALVDARFEQLELKIDSKVDHAVGELTRTLMFGLIGSVFTIGSICLAAIAVAT